MSFLSVFALPILGLLAILVALAARRFHLEPGDVWPGLAVAALLLAGAAGTSAAAEVAVAYGVLHGVLSMLGIASFAMRIAHRQPWPRLGVVLVLLSLVALLVVVPVGVLPTVRRSVYPSPEIAALYADLDMDSVSAHLDGVESALAAFESAVQTEGLAFRDAVRATQEAAERADSQVQRLEKKHQELSRDVVELSRVKDMSKQQVQALIGELRQSRLESYFGGLMMGIISSAVVGYFLGPRVRTRRR
jgi:hypothetical protein